MDELELRELTDRLGAVGVSGLHPLAGGASSVTYAGALGDRRVVVKVAPPGLPAVRNRDVLRQARIIGLLSTSGVPVPEVLWEDGGAPPDVPPLFVMSFLEGRSVEPLFDFDEDGEPEVMAERMRDAARTMAALHRVRPADLGLHDEPVCGPEQELDRWCRLLETVDQSLVGGWEQVATDLRHTAPEALDPVIVHGDFRLGNLLALGASVTAVIDWEIWSVGDPRVDAGWFLLNADADTYDRPTPYAGTTPPVRELARLYEEALGVHLPDLTWFEALAAFKSSATWSLIVKHNRRRRSPDGGIEAMATALPRLLERSRRLLA